MNTHTTLLKWTRRASGFVAVMLLVSTSVGQASARILFEDDALFKVQSEGIVMDENDNAVDDTDVILLQFGNDGTDATFTYTPSATAANEDLTIDVPGNNISFSDDSLTTTGEIRFEGTSHFRMREEAFAALTGVGIAPACSYDGELAVDTVTDAIYVCTANGTDTWKSADNNPAPGTSAGNTLYWDGTAWTESSALTNNAGTVTISNGTTLTANGVVNLGDGGDNVAINSSIWGITAPGVVSGLTGITSTGVINFSGATSFAMTQGAANPGTCTEGFLFYNTTDNTTYVCTAANTWTALSSGTQDFEAVYGADSDKTLSITDNLATGFAINEGANTYFNIATSNGTEALSINASNGAATTNIGSGNTTGAITIGNAAAGAVTVDSGAGISLDGAGASNLSTSSGDLTLAATANSVVITGAEAAADAVTITASNAAGGIDINAGTAGVSADLVGAGDTTFTIANSGAGNANLTVDGTGDFGGTVSVGAYTLTASDGSAGQVLKTDGSGGVTWQNDIDTNTTYSAGNDLDLSGTTFDIEPILNFVTDITRATALAGEDLTIGITGATDSSLILQSTGTGTDAVRINASGAGGDIDIDANDAITMNTSSGDITIDAGDDIIFSDAQIGANIVQLSVTDANWDTDFATDGILDNINDIATQLGGDTISTFNFTNDYVLADNDTVYAALNKIDAVLGAGADNVEDLTFYPEYPDSVTYPDGGGDNRGTLESLHDNANNMNYYEWTSTRAATQDMNVRFQFPLPTDFAATGNFTFRYQTGTAVAADNKVDVTLYNITDAATCGSSLANNNVGWATGTITAATINAGCAGISAGDIVRVDVKFYDNSGAADYTDVGWVNWAYTN